MYKLFASCHTVRKIQDEFMGDELDLRMFLFSGFSFELSENVNIRSTNRRDDSHIDVLRINQFESKFQCMSVLVRDVVENKFYAFVKGAAEKIYMSSINKYNKYDELISSLSLAGLRNIAFGYKEIQQSEIPNYLTCKR
jgi:magnesium-transporting ATPase (P-type)